MLNNPISILPIASLVRRHLAAGLVALRKKRNPERPDDSGDLWLSDAMTSFDTADEPTVYSMEEDEDVSPQTEAEIYVIFGRMGDAEEVLEAAVHAGRLTTGEVDRFWARMELERGNKTGI